MTGGLLRKPCIAHGLVALTVVLSACDGTLNTPRYFSLAAPVEVGGDNPPSAKASIVIPFRAPEAFEQEQLAQASQELGFQVPWLDVRRVALQIRYTIQNVSDSTGVAQMVVNGASEFANYDIDQVRTALEAVAEGNEEPEVISLVEPPQVVLGPGETFHGLVREEQLEEAALDLDALARWQAPYVAVLINRSEVDPIGLENVPPNLRVPAFQTFHLTCLSTVQVRCEAVVRVRDQGKRRWTNDDPRFQPAPVDYAPQPPEGTP